MVKRSWRYFLRFSALFSTLMDWKRLPIVPVDSSAARMPLPGVAIALCFSPLVSARRLSFAQRPPRQDDGLCKEGRTAVAINSSLNLSAIVAACVCVLGGFAVCCCRVAQSRAKKKKKRKVLCQGLDLASSAASSGPRVRCLSTRVCAHVPFVHLCSLIGAENA